MSKRKKEEESNQVVIHAVNPLMEVAMGHIPGSDGERYGVIMELKSEDGEKLSLFHDTSGSARAMYGAYLDAEKYLLIAEDEGYDIACLALESEIAHDAKQWDDLPWDEPEPEDR